MPISRPVTPTMPLPDFPPVAVPLDLTRENSAEFLSGFSAVSIEIRTYFVDLVLDHQISPADLNKLYNSDYKEAKRLLESKDSPDNITAVKASLKRLLPSQEQVGNYTVPAPGMRISISPPGSPRR
jgi:hypothetical protein